MFYNAGWEHDMNTSIDYLLNFFFFLGDTLQITILSSHYVLYLQLSRRGEANK